MRRYLVIVILSAIFTWLLRSHVPKLGYDQYKDVLGALLSISSIIFAIVGAWIAIIYPRALEGVFKSKNILDDAFEESGAGIDYLSELVETVLVSAIVLMVVLLIQFLVPILKDIISDVFKVWMRYVLFYLMTLLTLSQLVVVFGVILANYFFLCDLRRKRVDKKMDMLNL